MQNWKKKMMILGLSIFLAAGGLYGCGNTDKMEETAKSAGKENGKDSERAMEETGESSRAQSEKPETTQSEHPRFVADSIRKVVLVEDGEEIFHLSNEPAGYKMDFDYWEILNPYDETVTVNTEIMYELFDVLCGMDFQEPVTVGAETDTGIADSKTSITLDFVDILDASKAKQADYADMTATIILGNEDGAGNRFAAVQGFEDQIYKLSASTIDSIFSLDPFSYILKIPVLINIDTVESLEIQAGEKSYEMNVDSVNGEYQFENRKVEKTEFINLYQEICGIMLEGEVREDKISKDTAPELEITFHRNSAEYPEIQVVYYAYDDTCDLLEVNGNSYFLVKAEDVENLENLLKSYRERNRETTF